MEFFCRKRDSLSTGKKGRHRGTIRVGFGLTLGYSKSSRGFFRYHAKSTELRPMVRRLAAFRRATLIAVRIASDKLAATEANRS